MFRSVRPGVLLVLLVAMACTDQPTEPTLTEAPFQAVLGPPPADVSPLNGTLPAGNGGPAVSQLGFWESPALAKITVNGLLTWNNPGNEDGYFPRPSGQLNYLGRYIPSLNLCASQLSVRVIGYGAVGGAEGGCPGFWQTVSSVTNYNIVSGQVVLARSSPALGACYYGGIGCTTLTGEQTATVEPIDGQLTIKLDTTIVHAGQLVNARFGTDPVAVEGFNLPFTLREVRFEGQGPILGGGTPKGCVAFYSPTFCGIQFFQSGYVVAEGMVSGKLRTQKQWVQVIGGDSLPPQPPPDSIPPDSIPPDSIPGGGGGGGGGGCGDGCCGDTTTSGLQLADCNPPEPPRVEISEIATPYGDNSFMAWRLAEPVRFKAKVFPEGHTETVNWAISDDPTDEVVSAKSFTTPIASGNDVSFVVPAPEAPALPAESGMSRWYQFRDEEPGTLAHKSLAVRVRAYIVPAGSDTVWSEPFTLRQVAVDALRQEYVDLAQPLVPARDWVTSPTGSVWFSLAALAGTSDYVGYPASLAWLTSDLKRGLDAMQDVGSWLNLDLLPNSGYRNPVHNWMHVHLNQGYTSDKHSRHQFGAAADVNAAHDENLFYEISEIGAALGACMEPPEDWLVANFGRPARGAFVHDWTHVHVEFNPLTPCPDRMSRWSESLVY